MIVSGATGSGKTTVLYACLNEVVSPEIKVVTIEEPVEYVIPGTMQVQVDPHVGLTFPVATRSLLRSDPDVILIGEIRDVATLMVGQQAALTGHRVLATLHTDDAGVALKRMVDMGSDPFIVADATRLVVAQTLVRRLCPDCSIKATPSPDDLNTARNMAREGGVDPDTLAGA